MQLTDLQTTAGLAVLVTILVLNVFPCAPGNNRPSGVWMNTKPASKRRGAHSLRMQGSHFYDSCIRHLSAIVSLAPFHLLGMPSCPMRIARGQLPWMSITAMPISTGQALWMLSGWMLVASQNVFWVGMHRITPFARHVLCVCLSGAQPKVRWIHARWIITHVTHLPSLGYGSMHQFIGVTMRRQQPRTDTENTITEIPPSRLPLPAFVRVAFAYLAPEARNRVIDPTQFTFHDAPFRLIV